MRLLAVALFLAIPASASAAGPARDYWQAKDCARPYSAGEAHRGIGKVLRNHSPLTRPEGKRVWRLSQCAHSRGRARANIKYANTLRRWRKTYPQVFAIRFNWHYVGLRGHLDSIAACESHGDPRAINPSGTYRGKYQFSYSTWASVGGSGDPAAAHEWEQDYRAAVLLSTGGAGHWPNCG